MIVYHGTTKKFDHFDLTHLGEGEGKSKFGVGHYASSVFETAALYADKCKGEAKYVYTLEVPVWSWNRLFAGVSSIGESSPSGCPIK